MRPESPRLTRRKKLTPFYLDFENELKKKKKLKQLSNYLDSNEAFPWLSIGDYPPILDQKDNGFLSNNGSYVLGYEIESPEIYTLGSDDFESINEMWERALKNLPSGTIVHKQDYYFETKFDISKLPRRSFLEKATATHFTNRTFLSHRTLLFFSSPSSNTLKKMKLQFALQKMNLLEVLGEEEFINETFSNEITKTLDYLNNSSFFRLTPLDFDDLFESSGKYLNLSKDTRISTSGRFNLALQKEGLNISMKIGHDMVGMYALNNEKEYPAFLKAKTKDPAYSSSSFSFFKGLGDHFGLYLPFSHIYNQIITIDNPKYWIGKLEKKKEALKGLRNIASPIKWQYERLEKMLSELYKEEENLHFVRTHFNILFWEYDPKKFDTKSNLISSTFKSMDLNAKKIEGKELGHLFLNSHFANVANFSNHHLSLLPLASALCLFSHVSNYKSDREGLYFNDRLFNTPVRKDVWDSKKKRIKARNFAIFAPTGEGKSVLANHIIRNYIDEGYKVVIVDLGGSYEKLCHLYPSKSLYYKFEEGQALSSNPFSLDYLSDLTSAKLSSLVEFVLIHIGSASSNDEIQKVSLQKILTFYFEEVFKSTKEEASFTDFIAFVNDKKELICNSCELSDTQFDFAHFKHLSSRFIPGGAYSFLYRNEGENIKMSFKDKSLIVADLDAIKESPLLLSIYLSMLHDAIETNIWEDKTQRGIVLYDEFAKQLQFEDVLSRVIYFAQAIRKQNGALGIILQSISQLPDSGPVRSMIENIQVIYSLKNTKGYGELVKRLNLNEHQHYQLQSLSNNFSGKRKYSEFWMLLGNESNVYRLELPPEALYAYLTEGEENQEILDLYQKTGSMEKAIELYKNLQNKES